jgi:Ca2+-binding EF-hand superfamily protein
MFRVFGAVMLAAAAAFPAHAQAPAAPTPVPRTEFIQVMDTEFKQMDADKNGILTKKEIEDFQRATSILIAQRRNAALFETLDKDKNGQLSKTEFSFLPMTVPAPNAAPVLAQTDTNRDGQITAVEYRTGKLASFDRMDTDKDGIVSVAEMKAAGLIK